VSLSIHISYFDETTGEEKYVKLELGDHLAGFEVARQRLWGADIMKRLGLTILPRLDHEAYIVVEGEELDELGREAQTIIDNAQQVSHETQYDNAATIADRARNVFNAVQKAKAVKGRVSIG
jgi:hypothetical protein